MFNRDAALTKEKGDELPVFVGFEGAGRLVGHAGADEFVEFVSILVFDEGVGSDDGGGEIFGKGETLGRVARSVASGFGAVLVFDIPLGAPFSRKPLPLVAVTCHAAVVIEDCACV